MKNEVKSLALKTFSLAWPLVRLFDLALGRSLLDNRLVVFYCHFFNDLDIQAVKANLRFIRKNCTILPLSEAIDRLSSSTLPNNPAVIIVDDAAAGFLKYGVPLLAELDMPYALAVIPGLIKSRERYHLVSRIMRAAGHQYYLPHADMLRLFSQFMGDGYECRDFTDMFVTVRELPDAKLHNLLSLLKSPDHDFMTWDEIKAVHRKYNVEILNHSTSHPQMRLVKAQWLDYELGFSKELILDHLGVTVDSFVFPYGNLHQLTDEVRKGLAQYGYVRAYTSHHGTMSIDSDPLAIPRNNMECDPSLMPVNSNHILSHLLYDNLHNLYLRHRRDNPVPQF